jgi:ABC-type sugar transport system permease subunit
MLPTETTNQIDSTGNRRPIERVVLGVILLLPALFLCVSQLLIPTIRTFWLSFQSVDLFADQGEFVGLENYSFLFD